MANRIFHPDRRELMAGLGAAMVGPALPSIAAAEPRPALALQAIAAPVFHGHTFSISVELERPTAISAIEDALSGDHVDLVLEDTDSPSNLAATGQNDVQVRLRPVVEGRNPSQVTRFGSGLHLTTCGYMRRTPWIARWICGGLGRRDWCSKDS